MKKLASLLMILSLIISTLISFNPKEVQAKSFEEKRALFCGKDFFYTLSYGGTDSKAEVGETMTLNFKCNGTATSYSAYINVYHPNTPGLKGYDYGSKKFTKKTKYKFKVNHSGYAQVVFTFKDAKGKKLRVYSNGGVPVYSKRSPKIASLEGGTDFWKLKRKSSFTIKNKEMLYISPDINLNDINFRLSGQLLNDKKKVMDKKYVCRPGYYTLGIEPPKPGTYYVKVTQKNIFTGEIASKTCKLIVK